MTSKNEAKRRVLAPPRETPNRTLSWRLRISFFARFGLQVVEEMKECIAVDTEPDAGLELGFGFQEGSGFKMLALDLLSL